jgi:3D (Asp-Asp-Asp) domain-containing protein
MKAQRNILLIALLISLLGHYIFGLENMMQRKAFEYQINRQAMQIKDKQEQIELLEIMLEQQEEEVSEEVECEYLGEFEITYYTAGPESTGKYPGHPEYGITRSGTTVEEGRTIAADWSILEPGTKVYIDGIGERVVEDTGNLIVGKSIDVYVEDVEAARQLGRHKADVYILD